MQNKQIIIFHPDIFRHKTNNEYTIKIYNIISKYYEVKSLEWFIKHPFAKEIRALYLNWYENTVGKPKVIAQKIQYFIKILILRLAKRRKIKICYVIHNKTPHNISKDTTLYRRATKPFLINALSISDIIVELCEHTENYLITEFDKIDISSKICLVPHGKYTKYDCNPNLFREKYRINNHELLFAYIGKMDKYKNIDIIIQAFNLANINCKLLLVGSMEPTYEQSIRKLIVDDKIILDKSYVSDEEMSGLMQTADAIILPYENTSLNSGIMINAFSNGTTVIGTKIEMLEDYPSELVYGYSYIDREKHIMELSKTMAEAYYNNSQSTIKSKGKELQKIIEKQNDWAEVERKLLIFL